MSALQTWVARVKARVASRRLRPRHLLNLTLVVVLVALAAITQLKPDRKTDSSHGSGGSAPPPTQASPEPERGRFNSADRVVFWLGCKELMKLTPVEIDSWSERGVGGFVCMIQRLRGLGGAADFTGDRSVDLSGPSYALQRDIRDSPAIIRAKEKGMKLYLGFYLVNDENEATPMVEWFDNGGWSNTVLPRVEEIAGAARMLGFAGLAIDQELYPHIGQARAATWSFKYPGNTHDEKQTREQAKLRGEQMMKAILAGFPAVELVAYNTLLPEGWEELVQQEVNNKQKAFAANLHINLLDGLTSVEGYRAIRLVDAIFYKIPHLPGASWDRANQYNANRIYSLLSRRLSNWAYASSRVHLSPFSWIDAGKTRFEQARPPDAVAEQLAAFRRWGTGGEFANYAQGFRTFDYGPYLAALKKASTPGDVDSEPPELAVTATEREGPTLRLTGFATDNMAVRSVTWEDASGRHAVPMTWKVDSGDYRKGWTWKMEWSASAAVGTGGEIKVTVTDIKGLNKTVTVDVPT